MKSEIQELNPIFERAGLAGPVSDLNYYQLFDKETGRLRDKTKYSYNKKGKMDFLQNDLTVCVAKARFSIAKVLKYRAAGLASFAWDSQAGCGTYFPTDNDWLFYYYLDDGYSNLYSAWERVAGYLSIFWPLPKKTKRYFTTQIEFIAKKMGKPQPKALKWLVAFKEKRYSKLLNKHRKKVVHQECSQGAYFESWLRGHSSRQVLEELAEERDARADQLLECYGDLVQGVPRMLDMISGSFDPERSGE